MNKLKYTAALLLAGALLVTAASCNSKEKTEACKTHRDADNNGICDVCGAKTEKENACTDHIDTDADNLCDICDAVISDPVPYVITVLCEDGTPLADLSVKLFLDGEEAASGKTDAEGCFSATILPGSYTVSIDQMPEGWLVEGNGKKINISAENGSFSFTAIDNNPDGSEEKPFFMEEEPMTKQFSGGEELYFYAKGAEKYLVIDGNNVKVKYDGKEYLSENGTVRVLIAASAGPTVPTAFSVVNVGDQSAEFTMRLEALPGTLDNAFEGKLGELLTAEVSAEHTVYYKWVSTADGYLVLESESPNNHIMLYNTTSFTVTSYTDGARSTFIAVKKGDVLSIAVASKTEELTAVSFTLTICDGTAEDPLPLYGNAAFTMAEGSTLTFEYKGEEKKLTMASSGMTVRLNGVTAEAEDFQYTVKLQNGDLLTLILTATGSKDVSLTLQTA